MIGLYYFKICIPIDNIFVVTADRSIGMCNLRYRPHYFSQFKPVT